MDDIENLPKEIQVKIRTVAIVMALKKMYINTPELQEEFNNCYNEVLKDFKISDFLDSNS